MLPTKLPKWAIIGLAALVLLGIGSAVYNSGWSQGFLMGLLTGNMEGASMTPYLVSRTHSWHGGGFGFFGGFFRIIFFVFLLSLILKFFGFWRWRRHGWHDGPSWQSGPSWQGGPGERVEGQYGPWGQQPQPQPQQSSQQSPQQSPPQGPPPGQQPQQPTSPSSASDPEHKPQPTSWTQV